MGDLWKQLNHSHTAEFNKLSEEYQKPQKEWVKRNRRKAFKKINLQWASLFWVVLFLQSLNSSLVTRLLIIIFRKRIQIHQTRVALFSRYLTPSQYIKVTMTNC